MVVKGPLFTLTSGLFFADAQPAKSMAWGRLAESAPPLEGVEMGSALAPERHRREQGKERCRQVTNHADCLQLLCISLLAMRILEHCLFWANRPRVRLRWFTTRLHRGIYRPRRQKVAVCLQYTHDGAQPISAFKGGDPISRVLAHAWSCQAHSLGIEDKHTCSANSGIPGS